MPVSLSVMMANGVHSEPVPRRSGRDEVGLLAHLGEGEDALADVHEVHGHVLKLALGVLVHHPHDLAGAIAEPPPTAMMTSGSKRAICLAPRRAHCSDGSGSTS